MSSSREVMESLIEGYSTLTEYLSEECPSKKPHLKGTPPRAAKALLEFVGGVDKDATEPLKKRFDTKRTEMIVVTGIDFVSVCAHHLLPFTGQAHFGYLPNGELVGLSKIPRSIDILARRPQVQEELAGEIVDCFMDTVHPLGCGVMIFGHHTCTTCRGVQKSNVVMGTTALRGRFESADVKAEFLEVVRAARQ